VMRRPSGSAFRILVLLTVAVVLSASYVGLVDLTVAHQPVATVVGWTDTNFSGKWTLAATGGATGYISVANGTLTVGSSGRVAPGGTLSAQNFNIPSLNLYQYPVLMVTVRSLSVYLAVRIELWTTATTAWPLVLSTFDDQSWHTIYVDLPFLGLTGKLQPHLLELGWMGIQQPVGPNEYVQFENLSLVRLVGS